MADPMRKDVSVVRKRIDVVNKELRPLGTNVQKKVCILLGHYKVYNKYLFE